MNSSPYVRLISDNIILQFKERPSDECHDLIVEVTSYGRVERALVYVPRFDNWFDCTEKIRDHYKEMVEDAYEEHLERRKSLQQERKYTHEY